MKCIILAAGYATRLYPLTENFPKPLLPVGGKPILDWLIADIESSGLVDEYIVVTNHKFAAHFRRWASGLALAAPASSGSLAGRITVLDDGTSSNETRLGAVRDIQFAIDQCALDDDLLVIAGDNLLSFSLVDFIRYARAKGTSCVMRYYEPDEARLRKAGVAEIDADDRVVRMEEKPAVPRSHWCLPPFYYYRRADVPLVAAGIAAGCSVDAPGAFVAWLCSQAPVHAFAMPGPRHDIGDLASYQAVQKLYT